MQASTQELTATTHTLAHGTDAVLQGLHGAFAAAGAWGEALGQAIAQTLASRMHDLSIAALAIAVATLGAVMLIELRLLARLRASVDLNLARVFEQLDLLRLDQAQLHELPERPSLRDALRERLEENLPEPVREDVRASQRTRKEPITPRRDPAGPAAEVVRVAVTEHGALAAGEARLMASLAEARARRASAGSG